MQKAMDRRKGEVGHKVAQHSIEPNPCAEPVSVCHSYFISAIPHALLRHNEAASSPCHSLVVLRLSYSWMIYTYSVIISAIMRLAV